MAKAHCWLEEEGSPWAVSEACKVLFLATICFAVSQDCHFSRVMISRHPGYSNFMSPSGSHMAFLFSWALSSPGKKTGTWALHRIAGSFGLSFSKTLSSLVSGVSSSGSHPPHWCSFTFILLGLPHSFNPYMLDTPGIIAALFSYYLYVYPRCLYLVLWL